MGCPFCATGKYGFHGDLQAGEIINQVISLPEADRINHVVFMGMGEPMDNLGNVLKACKILTAEWGLALSPGNITVSTVGIRPAITEFLEKSKCNLTLSLFSPFSEERKEVIPIEKIYPAVEIVGLMKTFPVRKRRRLGIAYIMIQDINDTDRHLEALKAEFCDSRLTINLLPYHPFRDDLNISSSPERMQHFKHELIVSGISASIRKSRGEDIYAACGLLASGFKNEK
jgi:23S rRNA (adenine2503-C2)-methyltransferase